LSLGRPETAGGGRRGPLREGAEGAGPRLLGGNGAGLHGGEDWAWVGSEGGRSFRALRGWVGAASGPRQVQRAGAAGLAVVVLAARHGGPCERRPGLSRRATGSCGAGPAQLRSGPRVMGSEPREPGGLGELGAARGRGRGGAERVGPSWCCQDAAASLETGGWQPLPASRPGTLMPANLRPFLNTAVASFLLCPFSRLEIFFPEPCQKEWT
jgi:hypothetical protein